MKAAPGWDWLRRAIRSPPKRRYAGPRRRPGLRAWVVRLRLRWMPTAGRDGADERLSPGGGGVTRVTLTCYDGRRWKTRSPKTRVPDHQQNANPHEDENESGAFHKLNGQTSRLPTSAAAMDKSS